MPLTPAQLVTLGQHIAANPATINGVAISALPHTLDNAFDVAAWYNIVASPDYYVWRTSVTITEVMLNGFDWTRVDNLSVGKSRIWEWMFQLGAIDPSKPNIRAGIDAVWVGTAADLAVRAAVYTHCYRPCTRAESVFVTATAGGAGQRGTTTNPDTMAFEGRVEFDDVRAIWGI